MNANRKTRAGLAIKALLLLALASGAKVTAQGSESRDWAAKSIRGTSPEQPPNTDWWNSFHDEELTRLIHRAVANNLDLQLAAARVDEARAARGVAKSAFYPSVGLTTSAERLRERVPVFNPGTNTAAFHPVELNNFQVGFDSAWEIDVFGRIRNEVKAASANVRSAEENRRDVLLALLGEVASSYADLRGFQLRLEIAENNIQTQEDTVHLTQARAAAGLATQLDVSRAVAELETTNAVVPSLRNAISASIHRISVLVGQEPGALQRELEASAPVPVAPPEVPVGLPSDLLKRRPDVRRADDEIAAAAANVKAAKADYFPKFTLFGSAGRQATQLHDLSLSLGNFFAVGPAISVPIFTGGRIHSNIAVQNARWKETQLLYRSTVLTSLEETENALVNYSEEQERRDRLQAAVSQSQTALELSRELYRSGLGDFLAVLDAQRQLYGNEDLLAESQTAVTTNLIALYKALGGGWESFPQQ
jgi:outer membrane protein, multidrug efflux system